MNELIKIDRQEVAGKSIQTVNARDLHFFLEVGKDFSNWIKARITKYEFKEGVDFVVITGSPVLANQHGRGGDRRSIDYHLSLDMAKELSMVERNAKGKEARQYFIECERVAKQQPDQQPINLDDPSFLRQALLTYTEKVIELEAKAAQQQKQIEADRPKTIFADAVSVSHTTILIGDLAKILKQNGIDVGQKRLFERMRNEGFLIKSGSSWNMPTQRSMEMGLMEVKEGTYSNPDGSVHITKTTKITGKGQLYFINKFIEERDRQRVA